LTGQIALPIGVVANDSASAGLRLDDVRVDSAESTILDTSNVVAHVGVGVAGALLAIGVLAAAEDATCLGRFGM
jgi:hypothetical protein